MAKITTFAQIIKLIPRSVFESAVARHGANKGVRKLDSWTWFGALMFSQLSGHDSIRTLERVFGIGSPELSKLGFSTFHRSTFSDANRHRPIEMLKEIFQYSLGLAKTTSKHPKLKLDFPVYLLDSTFIELCLSLCPWAYHGPANDYRFQRAGVKMHTAIDLTGHLPEFTVIQEGSEAINNDLKVARENFHFPRQSLVVFDRGYWSMDYLDELNKKNVWFVTRAKNRKMGFRVAKSFKTNRTQGVKCDQHIYFNSRHTKGRYQGKLRRVSFVDPATKKKLVFITNRFDLTAETICLLYKSRWQIELFFKLIKQNFKIKRFVGLTKNAVLAQLYTALICYVLLAYLKNSIRSKISMPELMAVVGTFILQKINLINVLLNQHIKNSNSRTLNPQLEFFSTA